MSNNNIEIETAQFEEQLERMASQLGLTVDQLRGMDAEELRAHRAFLKYQDEYNAKVKRVGDTVVGFGKDVGNIGKQALNGAGSFGVLNSAVDLSVKVMGGLVNTIPIVGGAFKALGEAAGDVTKMMIEQFQTGWNAYKDLQDIGLASSFDDMRQSAAATGLLFQDVNKSLGKYTTDLANFGGSVSGGMKEFRKTSYELTEVRKQFNALGIGAAEFTEYQAKFMSQETRLGRSRNANLTEGTQKYIEQLDTLSKLTGLSRKDLQAQRDAALSETKFGAALSRLGPEVQESFQNLNSYITAKGGPELAQGLRDLTSGAVTSDAAKQLIMATGGKASEVVDRMKSGMITAEQGFEELRKSLNPKQMAEFAQYVGDSSIASKGFAQVQRMYNSKAPTAADIAREEANRKKLLSGQDKETSALANTENQLYDTSRNLQLLMTSSSLVQTGMDTMSDALDELSVKMLEMSGKAMPEELRARIEERKAIRAVNEAKEKERELSEGLVSQQEKVLELQQQIAKETDPRKKRSLEKQLAAAKREEEFRRGPHAQEGMAEAKQATAQAEARAEEARRKRQKVSGLTAKETREQNAGNAGASGAPSSSAPPAQPSSSSSAPPAQPSAPTPSSSSGSAQPSSSGSAPPAQPSAPTPSSSSGSAPSAQSSAASPAGNQAQQPQQVFKSPKEFYNAMYATLVDNAKKMGLANPDAIARLGAAQSAIETGYGKHLAGGMNYFGIKAKSGGADGGSVSTQEWDPKTKQFVTIQSKFRKYQSMEESAADYIKFLMENSRYKGVLAAKTVDEAIAAQAKTGYATDPRYGEKLAGINASMGGAAAPVMAQAPAASQKARTGGIFKGPSTGYNVELHEEEIVVPASDGVSKQALNSNVFGQSSQSQDKVVALLETMIDRYDTMIDLLDDGNEQSQKLVRAMA